MAVQDVSIVKIDNVPPWATARTQESIDAKIANSNKLLGIIAKKDNDALADQINALTGEVKAAADQQDKQDTDQSRNQKESIKLNEYQQKYLRETISSGLKGIATSTDPKSLLGSLSGASNDVARQLQETSPGLSKLAGGLAVVATSAAALYERLGSLTTSTTSLYATGLVFNGGMRGLAEAADSAGLSVETFAKVMSKFGAVGATLGVTRLGEINSQFLQMTHLGADLMMSQEQASDGFLQTVEIMRNSGHLVSMTNQQIAQQGKNMLVSFNELAEATGRNRDEILKAAADIRKIPDVDTILRGMDPDAAQKLGETFNHVSAVFGDQGGRAIAEMISKVNLANGSFGLLDDNMATAVNQIPGLGQAVQDAAKGIPGAVERMAGLLNGPDAKQIIKNLSVGAPEVAHALQQMSASSRQAADAQDRLNKMSPDERRAAEKAKKELEQQTARQNAINASFARFSNSFDKVAIALSSTLLPVIDFISAGFEKVGAIISGISSLGGGSSSLAAVTGIATTAAVLLIVKKVAGSLMGGAGGLLGKLMKFGAKNDKSSDAAGGGGLLESLGKGLGGIGQGIKGLGKGAGEAIYEIFKGIGMGLKEMASPKVFVGLLAMGLFAGEIWLFAKAMKEFEDLSWESMAKAAVTVGGFLAVMALAPFVMEPFAIAIAAAAATLAAASPAIVIGLGALGLGLLPVALALRIATPAFEAFGDVISKTFSGVAGIITAVGDSIANVFKAISGVDFKQMLTAGVSISGLAASLSAAAVLAPLVWFGSKVMSNAIGTLGESIKSFDDLVGPAGMSAFATVLDEMNKLDSSGIAQAAQGFNSISLLATTLADAMFVAPAIMVGSDIMSSAIENLGKAVGTAVKESGPGFETLVTGFERLAKIAGNGLLQASLGIDALGKVFAGNLFGSTQGLSKLGTFFEMLAKNKANIESGSQAIRVLGRLDITREGVEGIEALGRMFSNSYIWEKGLSSADTKNVEKLVALMSALGTDQSALIRGSMSLAILSSVNINKETVTGLSTFAEMFNNSYWLVGSGLDKADLKLVTKLGEIFGSLGNQAANFNAGAAALDAILQLDLTAEKIKGFSALSEFFMTSHMIWNSDVGDVKPENIKAFANIFEALGDAQVDIVRGALSIAALTSFDFSEEKAKGLSGLAYMFESGTRTGLNHVDMGNVDVFGQIFKKLADNGATITAGSNVLDALSSVDLSEDKIKGITFLINFFSSSIKPNFASIDNFVQIFTKLGDAQARIISGSLSLVSLSSINVSKEQVDVLTQVIKILDSGTTGNNIDGLLNIFDKFASSSALIIAGVDSMNYMGNLDLNRISNIMDLITAFTGSSMTGLSTPAPASNIRLPRSIADSQQDQLTDVATPPVTPVVPVSVLNDATVEYYAKTTMQFNKMIEVLERIESISIKVKDNISDANDDIVDAVKSISGTLF